MNVHTCIHAYGCTVRSKRDNARVHLIICRMLDVVVVVAAVFLFINLYENALFHCFIAIFNFNLFIARYKPTSRISITLHGELQLKPHKSSVVGWVRRGR